MRIKELYLLRFRRFSETHISFDPSLNVFVGPNGSGKTSLIEALFLGVSTHSFRTSRSDLLIQEGEEKALVDLHWEVSNIPQTTAFHLEKGKKEIFFNHQKLPTLSSLIGKMLGITLTPEDDEIIRGAPQTRRALFDLFLSQINPLFLWHLKRYQQALKIKIALLKNRTTHCLKSYEVEMSKSAQYVQQARCHLSQTLLPRLQKNYLAISGKEDKLDLIIRPLTANDLLEKWERDRTKEIFYGKCLHGIHKEEITLVLNGKKAKEYASLGESKSLAVAFKLALKEELEVQTGHSPIVFVDDLEAHLDQERQQKFLTLLGNQGQVFISSCAPKNFPGKTHLIE